MRDFWVGMAWVCIIEGTLYAVFPAQFRRLVALVQRTPDDVLRFAGLFIASLGVASLWLMAHHI